MLLDLGAHEPSWLAPLEMPLFVSHCRLVPPFEQLRVQLGDAVRGGALEPGFQLPTTRQLAHDLGLAPNTIAESYRSLDDDGLVQSDGRLRAGD